MTWFKVDDSFHSHPKVLAADPAALGLWVVAGAWCSANLTDGFVPDRALERLLPGSGELAEQLATCGLWRRAKGGYRFHDWRDYNPTADAVKAEREAARNRMREKRKNVNSRRTEPAKNEGAKQEPAGQPEDCSPEQPANVRTLFGRSSASPTRPDPTRSSSNEELEDQAPQATPPSKRGTRIPADFTVTPALVTWAREHCPTVDGRRETEKFRDHWKSASGANATKRDWEAAWRNWMRKAAEQAAGGGGGRSTGATRHVDDVPAAQRRTRNPFAGAVRASAETGATA